jgi:ABC-type dipeptide/oligopeptide/nickel transport system permease component
VGAYILRRIALTVPALFAVSIITFLMIHLVPGDPISLMLGADQLQLPQATVDALRTRLGLDRPLLEQYLSFVGGAVTLDLGTSIRSERPVADLISMNLVHTITLGGASLVFAIVFGIASGIVAAVHRGRLLDFSTMTLAVVGVSMPSFWLGLLLILVVAVRFGWLPATGAGSPAQLVLPALALGFAGAAVIARITRQSLLDVLGSDYMRTADGKGVSPTRAIWRHAMPNALIPVVTVIGLRAGHIIGGAAVVETVFNRPGIGTLTVQAIQGKDFPVIQGVVLLNLVVDILYAFIDPRIRYR